VHARVALLAKDCEITVAETNTADADQMRTQSDADQEPPVTQPPKPIVESEKAAGADDEETNEMKGTNAAAEGEAGAPRTLGVGLSEK
jgi:hypothetical protein